MPHYMILARYTPPVLKNLLSSPEALTSRNDHADAFYGSVGGKVVTAYFMRDARWHFLVIVDFPDHEAAHAAIMVGQASGAFEAGEVYPLTSLEEAVGALKRAGAAGKVFYPPGA
ncbi:GYD domain-containing protein [Corallococcus macrosporus]|uniref:GYD domain-containing protein n=2 Tax=Myxococcaceae TaxID=31 RepID=A0A286SGI2_9BACT|nr:GYD domain-containing protein [Corallococcus macrosporus]AEI63744.1 hypothetical protein LILAB_09165 [Corallococcus macrosporus]ATB51489.1 hypothetical protein MYMAC_007152 [Corallococcus macrosporus DSM 14697]